MLSSVQVTLMYGPFTVYLIVESLLRSVQVLWLMNISYDLARPILCPFDLSRSIA